MKGSFEVVKEDGYAKIKYRNEPELLIQVILGIATIFFWILSIKLYIFLLKKSMPPQY